MENITEYLERYKVWLRIQLGVAKQEDVKMLIRLSIKNVEDKIKLITPKEKENGTK